MQGDPYTTDEVFAEHLRAPGWLFGILGLMLGVGSGILTAVGIRNLGAEPILTGVDAVIFFVFFTLGVLGVLYVMLSSTIMATSISRQELSVTLGIIGTQRSFALQEMSEVRVARHSFVRHGGRGNPFAPSSRRAWTMFGVKTGVEFVVNEDGGRNVYFFSSRKGHELTNAIESRLKQG